MTTTNTRPTQLPEAKKPELNLTIWPDECLKYAVAPFPEDHLNSVVARNTAGGMIRAMYKHYGVGLAAPQVAVPFQIFVMDAFWHQPDKSKHPRVFLNPEITDVGDYVTELPHPGEGCLSFPYDFHAPVTRRERVELQWLDFKGEVHHEWFDGYEAIIIQHEFDHLTGHCFIDRLSQLKQGMAYRRARKMRRRYSGGMKQGMKAFKLMQKSPEALLDRNKQFEMNRKDALGPDNCEVCKGANGGLKGNENLVDDLIMCDYCHATPNPRLREAAMRYKEAIINGTLTTDIPSGDSEIVATRPSSRFTEGARRLVQREDSRRDGKRVQLPVSDQDQEGDERTSENGVSE